MKIPFFNKIKEVPIVTADYKPSFYVNKTVLEKLDEQMDVKFKGELEQNKKKFPVELGEEHPYDFKQMDELYKKFGFYTAVIDKYVDYIWGPGFYIKCDDDRGKEIIEQFIKDVDLWSIGREWTREGINKGNGFLELGGTKKDTVKGMKKLNASYMYVDRDNKGKIEGYNQYKGGFVKFAKNKVINFKEHQIAHFKFNVVGDSAYGLGLGITAMKLIDDWLLMQKSQHQLMDRKANAPLHAQMGYLSDNKQIIPSSEAISALGKDIEVMSNKTNWTTGPDVNFKVIDFGRVGEKFEAILQNDLDMMFYAFQIPPVLMGKANVPEGLAKVQMDAFQRRIQSIQAEIEKVLEQKVFKRVLQANGLDVDVEFEWGTPSIMETEGRLNLVTELVKSPATGYAMRILLEDELINLLKLDKNEWEKLKLEQEKKEEEERNRLEQQPQPRVPGQNANFPQKVQPKKEQPKQPKPEEMLKELKELFEKNINKKIIIKKSLLNKRKLLKSLLPIFNIEKFENNIKKTKQFIKRKKDMINYEYEKACAHCEESWENYNTIEEWLGFSYKKYLGEILAVLGIYDFNYIKAVNEMELEAGYLTETQINDLRGIMEKGFKDGVSIKEMAKQVDKKVGLKDLYRMNEDGMIKKGASGLPILARSADKRAIGIVRSETTRMANLGAEEYYKKNGITHEKWIASYGDRTCPDCEALNGTIYEIGKDRPEIPLHPLCRCSLAPVVDLISNTKIEIKENEMSN